MTGLRTLHAFCTRDPERGYPSRMEIQRELERLLAVEAEALECPHAPRPGPCYRTEDCPAGFAYDSVRNVCGHVRGPSVLSGIRVWESVEIDLGSGLLMARVGDAVSAVIIKNIGRE